MKYLVKVKSAVRSGGFHHQAGFGPIIEENRYASIFCTLGRDLDIVLEDGRRGNGVRARHPLAIDHPPEGQKLSRLGKKPSLCWDLETKRLGVVRLLLGVCQQKVKRILRVFVFS